MTAGQFDGALGSLTQKIGEANAGNRAAQQSFVELGLGFKTTAGEARATDAVMLDLAKRVTEIQDPSERLRVGTQLLGAEFQDAVSVAAGRRGWVARSARRARRIWSNAVAGGNPKPRKDERQN